VCPAQTALIRSAVSTLLYPGGMEGLVKTLGPAELGAVFEQAGTVKKLCDGVRAAIKNRVLSGGPIAIDEHRELAVIETEKEKIDLAAAWDLLAQRFGKDDMCRCLSISKTEFLKVVSGRAAHGQKGKAKDAIMAELRSLNATVKSVSQTPTIRPIGGK